MLYMVYSTLNPIGIESLAEPDVLKEVKQKLDLGSVKFEVSYDLSLEDLHRLVV